MLFGDIVIEPLELVHELARTVPLRVSERAGSQTWNAAALESLREIGHERLGCCVAPDPLDKNDKASEFLFDMIWYRTKSWQGPSDLALVAESEWSPNPKHIYEDFQKLLHAKAPQKILIFKAKQDLSDNSPVIIGLRDKYLRHFGQHVLGEQYIIVAFIVSLGLVRWYLFEPTADGLQPEASFQRMPDVAFPR